MNIKAAKVAAKPTSLVLAFMCALAVATSTVAEDKAKQRKQIQTATQDTLQRLYKAEPKTKAIIKRAYGYAVFSDVGVKILFGGTGNGKGIAVNNKTKHQTYMKMIELQAGLGLGVDKFRVVFVFDNQAAFDGFVNSGWEFGGQSTVAAKAGDKGDAMAGAVAVSDGVWMYQLTDTGLAADISATGTKYYKDDNLKLRWTPVGHGHIRIVKYSPICPILREAGAEARTVLLQMAAERLNAPVERLNTKDRVVSDPLIGNHVSYGELVQGKEL